jgi:hypothetical protein
MTFPSYNKTNSAVALQFKKMETNEGAAAAGVVGGAPPRDEQLQQPQPQAEAQAWAQAQQVLPQVQLQSQLQPMSLIDAPESHSTASRGSVPQQFFTVPKYVFTSFISVCERIGESVASVLGLDDSHFQEYVDTMTPEEMAEAEAILQQRLAEDELMATNSLYNNNLSLVEATIPSASDIIVNEDDTSAVDVEAVILADNKL